MNLLDLFVKISVDDSGLKDGVDRAKDKVLGSADTISAKSVAIGNAIYDVGKKAASTLVDFGKFSIDAGMAFDTSMSNVAAISGATGSDLEALTEKAKEMGAKTKFSASESADAFTYMAMAGWETGDMLDGIEGIMNLAAASGENLASVSDIVTDALTAFGLSAKDSGHFADVLAAASSSANTNVSMLGGSFKYVAPIAGALGYTIEDVSVALGLMANSGIKAEQAGTSMRSMLTRLAKPTKEVQEGFANLGISAEETLTNADGSMKPLNETIEILREKMRGLTKDEQMSVAASIAGTEAMSGLLAIVNSSDEDFNKLSAAVENANGTSEKMADVMLDNLPGAITIMKSALEGLGVAIYENGSGTMQTFVEKLTDVIGKTTEFIENGGIESIIEVFNRLAPVIVGATVAFVAYKGAMEIGTVIDLVKKAVEGLSASQAILNAIMNANPFVLVASVLAGLVSMLITAYMTNEDFRNEVNAAWRNIKETISESVAVIKNFFTNTIPNAAKTALTWFKNIPNEMRSIGVNLVNGLWEGIASMWDRLVSWFSDRVNSLVGGIKNLLGIHSPLRVFAGTGENMALGLGSGWQDEFDSIKRDITGDLDFGTAKVGTEYSVAGKLLGAIGSMGDLGGALHIVVQSVLDGKVIGETAYNYNRKKARAGGT